jgi:geranylgeranylglycerol-phosphate geranylgeranyltransferase
VLMGSIAAGLIAAFGNIHNDILDREIDRINRPDRPIPSGKVSVRSAWTMGLLFVIIGNVLGAVLDVFSFIITISASTLLFLYNHRLKMTVILGNITVSLLTALAFLFGGHLAGNIQGAFVPAVFSLLFHFSREVVKDMQDAEGDKKRHGRTFAQVYGYIKSRNLSASVLICLLLIVPLPYFAKLYNFNYLLVSILFVELPLIWCLFRLLSGKPNELGTISKILKVGMVMGLAALFMGS